jgi:hypothetical protein
LRLLRLQEGGLPLDDSYSHHRMRDPDAGHDT